MKCFLLYISGLDFVGGFLSFWLLCHTLLLVMCGSCVVPEFQTIVSIVKSLVESCSESQQILTEQQSLTGKNSLGWQERVEFSGSLPNAQVPSR